MPWIISPAIFLHSHPQNFLYSCTFPSLPLCSFCSWSLAFTAEDMQLLCLTTEAAWPLCSAASLPNKACPLLSIFGLQVAIQKLNLGLLLMYYDTKEIKKSWGHNQNLTLALGKTLQCKITFILYEEKKQLYQKCCPSDNVKVHLVIVGYCSARNLKILYGSLSNWNG